MLVVREALERDLETVASLERECFGDPWRLPDIRDALIRPSAHGWVAAPAERPQSAWGVLICQIAADEMEILRIAVAPTRRRAGVASMLLDRGLAIARESGVSACFLEARPSNEAAVAFYAAHGFSTVGRRRGYFSGDGEDALVLKREIHPTNERRTG